MEAFRHTQIISIPYNAAASFTNTPFMDSRIWSRLPQCFIDRILSFLPPPAFFRARAVCKRWYSLLFSTAFLELYMQVSPRRHWFLFFKQQSLKNFIYRNSSNINLTTNTSSASAVEGYLLDPYELKWYRLSFPSIPQGLFPASSSGGLVCWVSEEAGTKSILLCNPLIGGGTSLIQLPSTLRPRLCPSVGLNITDSSIDLVFAGDDMISPYAVKNLTSECFHIDRGGLYSIWGTTASLPRLCSLESGRMVRVEGRFYCMNYSPFSVLGYDMTGNQWCEIQAPMRRFLRSPSLVESRGKLMLVAAVEKSKLNVPKSLRLWTLQENGGGMWIEIERMPQQLYIQFAEMEGGRGFNCVAHGEFVVILVRRGSSTTTQNHALLYDLCGKRWLWIPNCKGGEEEEDDDNELHGFAYEPKLAVPMTSLLHQLTLPFHSFSA